MACVRYALIHRRARAAIALVSLAAKASHGRLAIEPVFPKPTDLR
jgi:hypothetical protein